MNKPEKACLLFLEDGPGDSAYVVGCLNDLGFRETTVIDNPESAIRALKDKTFDLALVEVARDDRDAGLETARVIQTQNGVPVILVLDHPDEALVDRTRRINPYGYLQKPVTDIALSTAWEMARQRIKTDRLLGRAQCELEAANQACRKEIEAREKAESQRLESETRWRTMADISPDAIFIMDAEGRFQYVNDTMASGFNSVAKDLVGRRESELLPPEVTGNHSEWVHQILNQKEPMIIERHVAGPKTEVWFDTRLAPLPGPDGESRRALGIARDITRLKQKERELGTTLDQLEKKQAALSSLQKAISEVARQEDFNRTAQTIFQECRQAVGASAGYVALLSRDGTNNEVVFLEAGGRPCSVNPELPMPVRGLRAEAYKYKKPVFENAFDESDWVQYLPPGHLTLENVLFFPLIADGQPLGLIGLANKPGGFSENDVEKVSGLAELAALALKRAAERDALAASEKRFRYAFEMSGIGMALIDAAGRFLEVNVALQKMLGFTGGFLLSNSLQDLLLPDSLEKWQKALDDAVRRVNWNERLELAVQNGDGSRIWCQVTLAPMNGCTGCPDCIILQVQDITNARLSKAKLKEITNTLEEKVRERTYHLEVLSGLSQELGFAPNFDEIFRILMKPLEKVVDHDIAASLVKSDKKFNLFVKSGRPVADEIKEYIANRLMTAYSLLDTESMGERGRRDNAVAITMLQGIDPEAPELKLLGSSFQVPLIVGSANRVAGILFVGTEKKQHYSQEIIQILYKVANQAAHAIERLDRRINDEKSHLIGIIESLPHGIIILDEQHRIVMMNSNAVSPLMSFSQCRQGEVLTHLGEAPISEYLKKSFDREWKDEIRLGTADPVVLEVIGRHLFTGPFAGGLLIALRDITEEASMTERVQQQERLAAVGQLAAGIAHDFNNLLTSIGGYGEMIATDEQVGPDVRERAEVIRTQVRRAAQLIRQILDFSRKGLSEQHPLELVSFLKESKKLLQRTIRENVHIEMRTKAKDCVIMADPVGLQQVIANLAINAQDAMPDGGRLEIEIQRVPWESIKNKPALDRPDGEYIHLVVADTGEGMNKEILRKIFDPFFTTKPVGRGTGLGLSQALGIVNSHSGFMDVESQPGEGTRFNIFLPAIQPQKTADRRTPKADTDRGLGELILLVEDEDVVRKMGRRMLENIGYQVITAGNGQEALSVYRNHGDKISLVLTDLVMPVMSGKNLIEHLKEINAGVKIIVWTGYPLEDEDKAVEQDIEGWVMKPPEIPVLAKMIHHAIHR